MMRSTHIFKYVFLFHRCLSHSHEQLFGIVLSTGNLSNRRGNNKRYFNQYTIYFVQCVIVNNTYLSSRLQTYMTHIIVRITRNFSYSIIRLILDLTISGQAVMKQILLLKFASLIFFLNYILYKLSINYISNYIIDIFRVQKIICFQTINSF